MADISEEQHLENKDIIFKELQRHPKRIGFGLLKEGVEAATGWPMDRQHWQHMARLAQHNPDQFHREVAVARKLGIGVRQDNRERKNR